MRSISIKVVQGLATVGAVMILTGANGEGCGGGSGGGGTGGGEPQPPPPEPCPPGYHVELVCYDSGCNDPPECIEECVPDNTCADGSEPILVCGGPPEPGCNGMEGEDCDPQSDPNDPTMPPPDDCWLECPPVDVCGPGYYEEWICDDGGVQGGGQEPDGGMDEPVCNGMDCPPPPEPNCYPVCLPLDVCPPGYHEEFICYGGGGSDPNDPNQPPYEEYCDIQCVPDNQCPPGTLPTWVCSEDPQDPNGGQCWEECLPYDDQPLPG